MNNIDYLKYILPLDTIYYKNWWFDALTITEYTTIESLKEDEKYVGQIVISATKPNSLSFINQENELVLLTDYKPGQPLMSFKDRITLDVGDLPNVKKRIETNIGNVLFNKYVICYAFGDKIEFMLGRVNTSKLENMIASNLKDTPSPETQRDGNVFYVDELLRYCNSVTGLDAFNFLCVPTGSRSTMVGNKAIVKRREELLNEYKDQLHDPAIVAKIMNELITMDKESFKDDPARDYYISDKQFDVIRAKKFIMYGIEAGLGTPVLITKALDEGWDMDNYPAMIDGMRSGSYARGKETAAGGTEVNWLQRVFQNISVVEPDCGAKHGMRWQITDDNKSRFVGLYYIKTGVSYLITNDNLESLVGQTVEIRTPMLCITKAPNYCATCVGEALSLRPNALHVSASTVGSIFMNSAMKSMHGKALKTNRFDFTSAIS